MPDYSPTVSCAEEFGSVAENFDDPAGFMSATVILRCAWADRHALVADLLGNRRQWPHGAPGSGVVPVATTTGTRPFLGGDQSTLAASGQAMVYDHALVTVNYSTRVSEVLSESIEPTAEFVTLDYRLFRWGSGNGDWLREEEAPGKLVRGINFVRSYLDLTQVQATARASIADIGKTHNASFSSTLLGLTFNAETLLFAPPVMNRKVNSAGVEKYDVTQKWTYNPNEWNRYYRARANSYQKIYPFGSSTPHNSYPVEDLSALLS